MEIWKDIPGYVGSYQVSDDGNVRSLHRLLASSTNAGVRKVKKMLKPNTDKQGRLSVALCADGEVKRVRIHRLVLLAFAGPCPDGMEGLHGVGGYLDNRISNLHWGTHLENMRDKVRDGTEVRGERAGKSPLTDQDVRDIRMSSDTQRALGARYGVSQVAINHIRARKTWKHV